MMSHMMTLSKLKNLRLLRLVERYGTLYCNDSEIVEDLISAVTVIHTRFNISAEIEIGLKNLHCSCLSPHVGILLPS